PRQRGPHHHHGLQRHRPLVSDARHLLPASSPATSSPEARPERASTPVQGGRTRVDGTAHSGCPGRSSWPRSPTRRCVGTLDVLTSEYLLRSKIVKHSTAARAFLASLARYPEFSTPVPHSLRSFRERLAHRRTGPAGRGRGRHD